VLDIRKIRASSATAMIRLRPRHHVHPGRLGAEWRCRRPLARPNWLEPGTQTGMAYRLRNKAAAAREAGHGDPHVRVHV
jgi:hypothetical protein